MTEHVESFLATKRGKTRFIYNSSLKTFLKFLDNKPVTRAVVLEYAFWLEKDEMLSTQKCHIDAIMQFVKYCQARGLFDGWNHQDYDKVLAEMCKRCPRCEQWLSRDNFYKQKYNKDKLANYCKTCSKERQCEARARDPERQRNSQRRYREQNLERVKAKDKRYYQNNRETALQRVRDWRKRNPNYGKEYYHRNRKKRISQTLKRIHMMRGNGGEYTSEEWERLLEFYDYKCLWCGETENITVDHVVAVSKGGSNDISNLQPLCKSCNSKKGTMFIDFRKELPPWIEEKEQI